MCEFGADHAPGNFEADSIREGSAWDRGMQHDCYPFVLYNIFAFWLCINIRGYEWFQARMTTLFREKTEEAELLIEEYQDRGRESRLWSLLQS